MISVIIATHNRAELLDVELQQIYKQKETSFEVIVVDDMEGDTPTRNIMNKYPSAIYVQDHQIQGPCNKFKAGFRIAQGQYLYMPNDDDYLTDDYFFSKCEKIFEGDKTLSFISGNATILYEYIAVPPKMSPIVLNVCGRISAIDYMQHFQETYDKPLSTCSTIFRKDIFDRIGIDNIIEFTDSSQYLLSLLYGDAYIMTDDVAIYRIQEKRNSLTVTSSRGFIINVLKQKEHIYKIAKKQLPNPRKFWANQYIITYSIVIASKMKPYDQFMINLWGLLHSHLSYPLIKYTLKNIIKLLAVILSNYLYNENPSCR